MSAASKVDQETQDSTKKHAEARSEPYLDKKETKPMPKIKLYKGAIRMMKLWCGASQQPLRVILQQPSVSCQVATGSSTDRTVKTKMRLQVLLRKM